MMTQLPSVMELMVATAAPKDRKQLVASLSPQHEPTLPLLIPRVQSTTSLPSAIAYGRKMLAHLVGSIEENVVHATSVPNTTPALPRQPIVNPQRRLTEPILYEVPSATQPPIMGQYPRKPMGMHSMVYPHMLPAYSPFQPEYAPHMAGTDPSHRPHLTNVLPYAQNPQYLYPDYFPPVVYTTMLPGVVYPGQIPGSRHHGGSYGPSSAVLHNPQSQGAPPRLRDENNALVNKRRIIKRRTRTGCLTCRKRRIKCDERKPHCFNCERLKKVCLGYEVIKKKNNNNNSNNSGTEDEWQAGDC